MGKRKKHMTPAERAAARRTSGVAEEQSEAPGREVLRRDRVARNLESARETLARRIVTTVEVVLVIFPFAVWGHVGLGGVSLEGAFAGDPGFVVSFLAAVAQPFVAWLIRIAYRHYTEGDGGYAHGNLIGLTCAELMLQNVVGLAGCAVLLWRLWRPAAGELAEWRECRGVGGVAVDISGALVVIAIGAVCAFASWRLGLA